MAMFRKAERRQAKLRLAITGPSGSGKTWGALEVARGLTADHLEKVALIDTEHGSGELYAHKGDYSVLDFRPPYDPKRYITAIKAAEEEGFEVIIIDSLSHAWSGEGGLLDYVDRVAKASRSGNTFNAWREGTPVQNALINAILESDCHVICTLRSKVEYVVEANAQGKQQPRKIGLAPEQRKDMDYEFTVVFDLAREGHMATASKDRTGIFDEFIGTLNMQTGEQLLGWLTDGSPEPPQRTEIKPAEVDQPAPEQRTAERVAEKVSGNGHVSAKQVEALTAVFSSKGYSAEQVLRSLHKAGICEGGLETIPSDAFDGVLAKLVSLPSKTSETKEEPPAAPEPPASETVPQEPAEAQEQAASPGVPEHCTSEEGCTKGGPYPESDCQGCEHLVPGGGVEAVQERRKDAEQPASPQQKRMLGMLWNEILTYGRSEPQLRADLKALTGKTSRKALTVPEATKAVKSFRAQRDELKRAKVSGAA
jgi:hypothetical protein